MRATRAPLAFDQGWMVRRSSALERLRSVPIFYKVLVANSLIVVVGAVFGTWLTVQQVRADPTRSPFELVGVFAVLGVSISVTLNYLVLKAAFQPLDELERTVDEVRRGRLDVRPRAALFSDPIVDKLRETFTATLETIDAHRQQLQKLSSQVIRAQEDERRRVARELHDEAAQMLTTLLVRLKVVEREADPAELRRGLSDLRELTGQTLEAVRDLALELRPPTLDDLGLIPALRWHVKQFADRCGLRVDFSASGLRDDDRLGPELELVLYRVVQEALTNVAKHARATRVWVRVERRNGQVQATVRDDGQGFEVGEKLASRERGLGLFGMRERAALVGGTLDIESRRGRGTTVRIAAPLPELVAEEPTPALEAVR